MEPIASSVIYGVVLWIGWASGAVASGPARRPYATAVAVVVVGVPSLAQLTVAPWLLDALGRQPGELRDGELWRLVTSLVVQDGGWTGTAFNLGALALVGSAAEGAWGPRRWAGIVLLSGVGAQFWGLVVQPDGAGNSVAVFGLAAANVVRVLTDGPGRLRLPAAVAVLGGVALLAGRDVHGGAVAIGAATAVVLLRAERTSPVG